jgi:hypothetical protein
MIEKLADLHKQATTERSHYYVAGCTVEAAALIRALVKERRALARAMSEIIGEATAGIAYEAQEYKTPEARNNPDGVLMGLRSIGHIKMCMIREVARTALMNLSRGGTSGLWLMCISRVNGFTSRQTNTKGGR